MGISCCKTEDSVDGRERHNRASKKYEQCDGFGRASIRGSDRRSSFSRRTVQSTFIPPISFDVVIPDKPTRSEHRGHHASFAAFAPLHTAASPVDVDLARTLRDNNPLEMSFTNDFSEVDRDAVQQFVHLVDLRQSMDGASPTPSPRDGALSMEMSSIMWGQGGCARGPSMEHTVQLTAEDIDYINAGASNEEQCARMVQMEEMFRQNLIGLWNMRSTLLQLAARRLVPTLRERRHAGRHALTSSTSGTSDGMRRSASMPPRTGTTRSTNNVLPTSSEAWADASPSPVVDNSRGVVLVHAVGMELGSEVWSPLYASSRGNEGATVSFADWDSPANLEGTIHTNLSRHPSNLPSPRSSTLVAMKVEHYELLALTCRDVQVPSKGAKATVVSDTWDFLSMTDSTRILNAGDALFRFMCMPVHEVDEDTLDVLDTFCNVSSFRDEVIENNVPHVNLRNRQDAEKYITIMVKAMYMLPGVKVSDLTPELVSSVAYQKNCQPGSPKIEPTDRSDTFRMQLSIIKFVFSMTIQLKVSEVTDPALLYSFKVADGIVPAKALLLERTKRDKTKSDSTAKVRSLLLYYPVNDGVLVTNQTLVLNTSLPTVASKVLNVMGSKGSSQTAETAQLTRNFLYTKLNLGKR